MNERTNITDTGYSYGGKDYTYETRLDANNNPYRVDVPVGTAPALNKAPDGTQPLVYGGQPKVSTTTISNTNKINEVPKILSKFEQVQKRGISTDASGVPRYADGSQVPDYTDPIIPEGTTPIYGTVNGVGNRIVGYNTPDLTSGGMTSTYLDSTGKSASDTSAEERQMNTILEQMKSSTDSVTKRMLDNIQSKMELRRQQLKQVNESQLAGVRNSLLMGGATGQGSSAQYAPLSSSNTIGDQIRLGIMDLARLDAEEADLIARAEDARESGNYKVLEKQLALVDEKRKEKVALAKKKSEEISEQNKKDHEQLVESVRSQNISRIYQSGITDVSGILNELKKEGVNVTSQQVADILKNIVPPGLDDLVKTMRINNAPLDKIQAVLSSSNINDAYKNAGVYGNGGTGITGEYNRYVADATSRGQIPISYDDFQTRDMNRKVSIARAGAAQYGDYDSTQSKAIDQINNSVANNPAFKKYVSMQTFINNVEAALSQGSGIGDIAAINQFQKVIDEGAVTRDQDVDLIRSAQSLSEGLQTRVEKLKKGDQLSHSQRKEMLILAGKMLDAQKNALEKDPSLVAQKKKAERFKVDINETALSEVGGKIDKGADIIQSEEEAKTKVINYGAGKPEIQKAILQMRKDKIPYQDILKYYNQ